MPTDFSRDLERELATVTADRDKLLECQRYCATVLSDAGHDGAAPLEAMVRRSIAYANRMQSERDAFREQLAAITAERDKLRAALEDVATRSVAFNGFGVDLIRCIARESIAAIK